MNRGRKVRAAETERLAREFWKRVWPLCHTKGMSTPGRDIEATRGAAIEVKATRGLDIQGSLRQAKANSVEGEYPVVMYRPPGCGPEKVAQWPCVMYADDLARLFAEAGYAEEKPL